MKTFHLLITNPERTFYDGEVQSVTSANQTGPFDILADHAHFISLVNSTTVVVINDINQKLVYQVVRGVISAKDNLVRVFVDI